MEIVIFDSNLEQKDIVDNPTRIACRGVVFHDDKILSVYEEKWDLSTLPGGGLEPAESLEDCVIREIQEETGVLATNPVEMVRVVEHFQTESFVSVYFRCDFVEQTSQTTFTKEEQEVNLQTRWLDPYEFMNILSNEFGTHPFGENIHNREFIGLINSM